MRLTVIGDDLVVAGFLNAAKTVNERLVEAGKPVAETIADTQRQMAPERSGETVGSISAVRSERDGALFEIGPETFYSRFLEYGTVKMAPRPFVGPSGDLHADDWVQAAETVAGDL